MWTLTDGNTRSQPLFIGYPCGHRLLSLQAQAASAQSPSPSPTPPLDNCVECYNETPTPSPSPSPSPSPTSTPNMNARPRPVTGSGAGSINDLAGQRFNQMITDRVLGTVLLGVNEQVNCNDCISALWFGGFVLAGIHGRKNLTPNLSLLAGIAYTQYNEGGYRVTSSPIGAFALRYDFVDWGSSRPFFDIGTILSPFQKGALSAQLHHEPRRGITEVRPRVRTTRSMAVWGWMSRLSPRDEVAASVEVWSYGSGGRATWTRCRLRSVRRLDRHRHRPHHLVKVGGQWTICSARASRRHQRRMARSFGSRSGIVASVTGDGTIVPFIGNQGCSEYRRPARLPHRQGLGRRPLSKRHRGARSRSEHAHGGAGSRISY